MKPELAQGRTTPQPLLSRGDVENLISYGEAHPDKSVLSLYLDTDPSKMANLNRGFEVVFQNMVRQVLVSDDERKEEFEEDVARVVVFLNDHRETRRALVIFCDASENFFWTHPLGVNVRNILRWQETPYLQPLLELVDEHERYGVVLADREKARLLTVFLGEIEEYSEAFAEADVKRVKSSGSDHPFSQMHVQRKADLHARWHLKAVAQKMSRLASQHKFDRLILGGPIEATSELYNLLPKALRARVVSKLSLAVESSIAEILEETLKVEEKIERQGELDIVEALITSAMKNQKAVLGLENTLLALQEGRVWELVYAEGLETKGGQCTNCGALLTNPHGPCVYCGKPLRTVENLIEVVVEQLIQQEQKIEQVKGPAAIRLREAGGIGAILHY